MARLFKKPIASLLVPAVVLFVILSSCHDQGGNKGGVLIPLPVDSSEFGQKDHFIPREDIDRFKKEFTVQRDSLSRTNPNLFIPISEAFNKKALLNLLRDSTNVGLRVYYGIKKGDKGNEVRLMFVGVNAKGEDLYYREDAVGSQLGAKLPPPRGIGGVEYGQCTPPCTNP